MRADWNVSSGWARCSLYHSALAPVCTLRTPGTASHCAAARPKAAARPFRPASPKLHSSKLSVFSGVGGGSTLRTRHGPYLVPYRTRGFMRAAHRSSAVTDIADTLQVHKPIFIRDNARKGAVKVHLDTKNSLGRSAAVKRSISICNAKIPSGATRP